MGCKTHTINGYKVRFSEADDEFPCMCTFPHNYIGEGLGKEDVQSLAMLGAVMLLIEDGYYRDTNRNDYIFLPSALPEWILEGIRKLEAA